MFVPSFVPRTLVELPQQVDDARPLAIREDEVSKEASPCRPPLSPADPAAPGRASLRRLTPRLTARLTPRRLPQPKTCS
jgi:hypothetical protein